MFCEEPSLLHLLRNCFRFMHFNSQKSYKLLPPKDVVIGNLKKSEKTWRLTEDCCKTSASTGISLEVFNRELLGFAVDSKLLIWNMSHCCKFGFTVILWNICMIIKTKICKKNLPYTALVWSSQLDVIQSSDVIRTDPSPMFAFKKRYLLTNGFTLRTVLSAKLSVNSSMYVKFKNFAL